MGSREICRAALAVPFSPLFLAKVRWPCLRRPSMRLVTARRPKITYVANKLEMNLYSPASVGLK